MSTCSPARRSAAGPSSGAGEDSLRESLLERTELHGGYEDDGDNDGSADEPGKGGGGQDDEAEEDVAHPPPPHLHLGSSTAPPPPLGLLRAAMIPGVMEVALSYAAQKGVSYILFWWLPTLLKLSYKNLSNGRANLIAVRPHTSGAARLLGTVAGR